MSSNSVRGRTRSFALGTVPTSKTPFRVDSSKMTTAVGIRAVQGAAHVKTASASYRLGHATRMPSHALRGPGASGVVPVVEVYMVDEIMTATDSAIESRLAMQRYRIVANKMLAQVWKANLIKEFYSGPTRWDALSRGYMLWKMRQGKGGIANLILSSAIKDAVDEGEKAVKSSVGSANPTYRIDVLKLFKDAPHVWRHEAGIPDKLPQRDFIRRAMRSTNAAFGAIPLTEFIIVTESMKGRSVTSPRTLHIRNSVVKDKPGTFSFAWLGKWFSKPYWWVVPPSKALLYFGIASDVRSILTRGIDIEGMAMPFMGAWGLGIAGAKAGVPLTKKTARRKFRRKLWRR